MIRDVGKARDYYWSLLEEAKGKETAGQDRIAQAKRGDTSNLYRGAYTENGELLVDTITEDEYKICTDRYNSGRPDTRKYCGKRTSQMQRSFSSADT